MIFSIAPQAESDLDEIWFFLATQSSSIDVADRLVDSITARFAYWWSSPTSVVAATKICGLASALFPSETNLIAYRVEGDDVLILRVLRGSRDIEALFRD